MSNTIRIRATIEKWSKADYNPFERPEGIEPDEYLDLNVPPLIRAHVANMFHTLHQGANTHMNHEQVLRDTHKFLQAALADYREVTRIIENQSKRPVHNRPTGKIKAFRAFDKPKVSA